MARKKLTDKEKWDSAKKYRVRRGDLIEADKEIVETTGPYDEINWGTQIESDGFYETFYTDKKEAYKHADRVKGMRPYDKEASEGVRVEEYYRRQYSNRGKRYKTGKGFNIRDLVM